MSIEESFFTPIEDLAKKATKGEWKLAKILQEDNCVVLSQDHWDFYIEEPVIDNLACANFSKENAEYIIAVNPDTVLKLVALARLARHSISCPKHPNWKGPSMDCDCGLSEALPLVGEVNGN